MLQRMQPGPPGDRYTGSFILRWRTLLNHYSGSWTQPPNGLTLTFTYNFTTGQTTAAGTCNLGGDLDWIAWPPKIIDPPPMVEYQNAIVNGTFFGWRSRLEITG